MSNDKFRVHIAKTGDNANLLGFQYYGQVGKAQIIIESNTAIYNSIDPAVNNLSTYSIPPLTPVTIPPFAAPAKEQTAGTARKRPKKTIPKTTPVSVPEKVNVSPDTVIAGYSDEVALYIEGKVFKYFDDVNITKTFDSISDTFSLSMPNVSSNLDFRNLIKPFKYQEIAIYIGGQKELTGYIITPKTISNPDSKNITIEGYSKTGFINDCTPSSLTKCSNLTGLDLMQIAELLCNPYGVSVIFESEVGAKFTKSDKIQIDTSKKIVEILTPLAKQRGLVISNTRNGELLFQKSDSEKATMKIDARKPPCIKSDVTYNGQNRFSDITVTKKSKTGGAKITVSDEAIKKAGIFRQTVLNSDNSEEGNLKNSANSKIGRTIAESISINADFFGWKNLKAETWEAGDKILFLSPDDFINSYTELMIKSATLKRNSDSLTSSLSLCFPQCYSGEKIEVYPWD